MRKKALCAVLSVAMVASMFAACGSDSSSSSSSSKASSSSSASDSASASTSTSDASSSTSDASDPAESSSAEKIPENKIDGADTSAANTFVVWGWNQDIKKILDGVYKTTNPDDYARIAFLDTGGSNYYQTKLDVILKDSSSDIYPDLMGLEADYVLKYVQSDDLLPVSDLGITADDYKNQYQYNLDLCTDEDGVVKALFWQATPGAIQVRADLAEKYLGTTDPDKLQADYFADWDKVVAAAKKVAEASGGKAMLFPGYNELMYPFLNSLSTGWYDSNDKLQLDASLDKYFEVAKSFVDDKSSYNVDQWGEDWGNLKNGDGVETNAAVCYVGCPWFTYWCLDTKWEGKTILVKGPTSYYYGGTGLAATKGCSDKEMAGRIIKAFTCDKDFMVSLASGKNVDGWDGNCDFVNNSEATAQLSADGFTSKYMYGTQSYLDFYSSVLPSISAKAAVAEQGSINGLFYNQVKEYANGNKDMDTAKKDFKKAVVDTFSYLSE